MSELMDIKTIALNLEVTRQTVYNHIEKNVEQLKGSIRKIQGITYLNPEGVRIIKESMGLIKVPVENQVIGIEEIIKEISESMDSSIKKSMADVKEDIKESVKKDYDKLENELQEVKKQNEILIQKINIIMEKQEEKKSIFNIFKRK